MATAQVIPRLVYRNGKFNDKTFTPRPVTDTLGRPGQAPGLSTFHMLRLRRGEVAQLVDLTLLQPPLQAIPDDVAAGGTAGHIAIAPIDANGDVDQQLLDEWAATRGRPPAHSLTRNVQRAVVKMNVR